MQMKTAKQSEDVLKTCCEMVVDSRHRNNPIVEDAGHGPFLEATLEDLPPPLRLDFGDVNLLE